MQAQQTSTTISPLQSLAVVKTLLSSSFGCIAYLRNLLPSENFGEGCLTATDQGAMSYESSSQDTAGSVNRKSVSNVKIKTVTRGFSTEADKLLDYLEVGVFHALEHQYLKSFVFAIYLDNQDPNNIIEAYTYNFSYRTVPGTDVTIPIMSLGEDLMNMSLHGRARKPQDPVTLSTLKGHAPTLGDVKKSVKAMIRSLILITQSMDALPKRRFATFKLFYRDHTPADYEPPHFRPGDPEKDKFIFTTHKKTEIPEKFSVGSVVTPHHGVNVHVESVACYLPSTEDNNAQCIGHTPVQRNHVAGANAVNVALRSKEVEVELQRKDAQERDVVWDADADAEGELDPDYINDSGIALQFPLGLRTSDGTIIPVESIQSEDMVIDTEGEAQYCGMPEIAPSRVGKLQAEVGRTLLDSIAPTQQLEATQADDEPENHTAQDGMLFSEASNDMNGISVMSHGIDTQILKDLLHHNSRSSSTMDNNSEGQSDDADILDLETQVINRPELNALQAIQARPKYASNTLPRQQNFVEREDANCACELSEGGDIIQCEGVCEKWYHIWCMGYHSTNDVRLPRAFICLHCRLHEDVNFELISHSFSEIMSNLSEIALFRRAIKLAETYRPESLQAFKKVAKCRAILAEQLWRRLQSEDFVVLEMTKIDASGLMETQTKAKTRSAKKNARKNPQHCRYVFDDAIKTTSKYQDYFSPNSDMEKTMLGLVGSKRKGKSKRKLRDSGALRQMTPVPPAETDTNTSTRETIGDDALTGESSAYIAIESVALDDAGPAFHGALGTSGMESQTQEETQLPVPSGDLTLKRKKDVQKQTQVTKRIKISVADGIDMEE